MPASRRNYAEGKYIAVPPRRINEIVHGTRRISTDSALRLARFFGTSERFWLNLQDRYNIEIAREKIADILAAIEPPKSV